MRKRAISVEIRAQVLELLLDGKACGLARTAIDDVVREIAERTYFTTDDTKLDIAGHVDVADYLAFNRSVDPHRYGAGRSDGGGAKSSDAGMICGLTAEEFNKLPPDRRLELYAEANRPAGY